MKKIKFVNRNLQMRYILFSKQVKVHSRASTINRYMVNKDFFIHDGLNFCFITVATNMVGFKFGDFVTTRVSRTRILYQQRKINRK